MHYNSTSLNILECTIATRGSSFTSMNMKGRRRREEGGGGGG